MLAGFVVGESGGEPDVSKGVPCAGALHSYSWCVGKGFTRLYHTMPAVVGL